MLRECRWILWELRQLHIMPPNPKLEVYSSSFWKTHMHMIMKWQIQLSLQQQMSGGKGMESQNMAVASDAGLDIVAWKKTTNLYVIFDFHFLFLWHQRCRFNFFHIRCYWIMFSLKGLNVLRNNQALNGGTCFILGISIYPIIFHSCKDARTSLPRHANYDLAMQLPHFTFHSSPGYH